MQLRSATSADGADWTYTCLFVSLFVWLQAVVQLLNLVALYATCMNEYLTRCLSPPTPWCPLQADRHS